MTTVALNYTEVGTGRPTVLLMGLGAAGKAWRPHYEAWSISRRCIVVENRGAGGTPLGDEAASTALMALDVAALLDSLGTGPTDLVGISMGSCIAQELALQRPDLVRSLVLVAPWAVTDPYTASVLSCLNALRSTGTPRLFAESLRNLVWSAGWINAHSEQMEAELADDFSMSAEAFEQQAEACRTHNTLERLDAILVPTLITYGDADHFVTPDASLIVAQAIKGATATRFDGAGHVHHWERLQEFNSLVSEWLQ